MKGFISSLAALIAVVGFFTGKDKLADFVGNDSKQKSQQVKRVGGNSNPKPITRSTTTRTQRVSKESTEVEKELPVFSLTVSNIIGFPQNAYKLKERLLGLPGFQSVSLVESSFQTDTSSVKYYIKFAGGDNKQLINIIRSKIVLFTFDRRVKYSGEKDIKVWVSY